MGEWDRFFYNGINKNVCWLSIVNVKVKSVGWVYYIYIVGWYFRLDIFG